MMDTIHYKLAALVILATTALGCASEAEPDEEMAESSDALTGTRGDASCTPSRAAGAVPAKHRALLDTIAWTEGTSGRGSDGYNVIVGYKYAASCNRHPNRVVRLSSRLSSSAAGRYQFLTGTWNSLGYPTFQPDNQDRAGMKLVERRGVTLRTDRAMTATELSNVLSKISYEWASLPPGRYGQPVKTASQVRAEYCRHAGCGG